MTAETLLQNVTDAIFVAIFALVALRTVAEPSRAHIDSSLLFGAIALIVAETWLSELLGITTSAVLTTIVSILLMALPYFMLRLVDDFRGVPRWLLRAAEVGLASSVVLLLAFSGRRLPGLVTVLLVAYFVAISGYAAGGFIRAAQQSSGVTRRRMRSVALGTGCIGLIILVAGIEAFSPGPAAVWLALTSVFGIVCGVAYFLGFAPPGWLRRAWQEPELRAFLGRAAALPRLPDTTAIVRELEHGAASSMGTQLALIGVRNGEELEFPTAGAADALAIRAFETRRPAFSANARRDYPADDPFYRAHNVNSVLAVPIVAGQDALGVLAVYAVRAPIFAEDDLQLAQLLADQAAVILESRSLIDEATRVRAREEAARLKDDFLSAAAHDLKTPLTALLAQAQLLEHRARRVPDAPADLRGIERVVRESQRLRRLVTELLDVGRVESGKLVDRREPVNLAAVAREACEALNLEHHACLVDGDGDVTGLYDPVRIRQLVDNLVENAVKYSPEGGLVEVTVRRRDEMAVLTVRDRGIGIPADDIPLLFDRFHRGGNVDDRQFAGMGLGLFICRGIAEQHGGRLWATSPGPGQGSTFHVELPLREGVDRQIGQQEPAGIAPVDMP